FVDTIRTLRAPAVSHLLGHVLMGENDKKISLIERVALHARATAKYAVWYGEGRDTYDVRGRTAHESVFNTNDGNFRCPNSQQGYSPFSTWTRGLAWAALGFAEQLEYVEESDLRNQFNGVHDILLFDASKWVKMMMDSQKDWPDTWSRKDRFEAFRLVLVKAAQATADFYIENSCADGVPMW